MTSLAMRLPSAFLRLVLPLGAAALVAALRAEPVAEPYRTPSVTGTVLRYHAFPSSRVEPRDVFVWLPPSYATHPGRRYPVLYMHDGQCLFDPAASLSRAEWGIDEAMTRLVAAGRVREAIVVGIANTLHRAEEYIPQKAVATVLGTHSAAERALERQGAPLGLKAGDIHPKSDAYLAFIVRELKPFVDRSYRTLPDRADTLVAGSSLGGLVSLYAICEYPGVFGAAACISSHWPVGDGLVIDAYLSRGVLPDPRTHRLYFDHGTETLDSGYAPYQKRVDALVRAAGYREGVNWETRVFPGADHSERAWRDRADVYLEFLLGTGKP